MTTPRKPPKKRLAVNTVDTPALFNVVDVAAVQAVYRGTASPEQQIHAINWIIMQAANVGGQSFRVGDQHSTAFFEGRRFVGAQILGLLPLNVDQLKKATVDD